MTYNSYSVVWPRAGHVEATMASMTVTYGVRYDVISTTRGKYDFAFCVLPKVPDGQEQHCTATWSGGWSRKNGRASKRRDLLRSLSN